MKIIFISHAKISELEGDSIHVLELAKNLIKLGDDLLLICQDGGHIFHNLKISRLPGFRVKYFTSFFLDLISIPYLFFYIKRFKPDIVYYREVTSGGIVSWLLKVSSVAEANGIYPDIAKIEQPLFFKIAGKFLLMRERLQYFRATRIICVTEGIKNELVKHYGVKNQICRVIHNGVNTHLFKPMDKVACRKRLGIKQDCFYMGFVGSFKAWRGLENLIEAMTIVKERKYDNIKCLFIGDGYLMSHLKKMVNRHGLSKDIIFKGRVKYEDVPVFINSFDICYLCWIGLEYGSSALKLYEYLACARPVIASRVEGDTEMVEKGNCGYLFDPGDAEDLASRIVNSYNKKDKLSELGMNGKRLIEDQFSWERVAKKVRRVIREAVHEKRGIMD